MPLTLVRVLHAVHAYPPEVGGSEAVVHRLSQGLQARGHEVEVATRHHPERGPRVDGVPVYGFEDEAAGWLDYRSWVKTGIEGDRWDVVMTYHSKVWTHLALAPFGGIQDRWIYAPTEFTDVASRLPHHLAYYRTLEPLSLRRAERVMVLTEHAAEQALELAGQAVRDRLSVLPNGTDVAFWQAGSADGVRERFDLPDQAPLVLYVGSLWPHKDVETLVDALAHLDEHHLVVAGPVEDRGEAIEARAGQAGVRGRVHLLGRVAREDLRTLYHAASVHASASRNEGFGLTFLEALACDRPVVAREVGVIPELVEQGADVRTADSAAGFADAIEAATRAPAGGNASIAKRYDWERIVDDLEALYQEVAR